MIPYGRQIIDETDIQEVVEVLRSDWLTTGPLVGRFEKAVAEYCETSFGVAVSSGTAALHTAFYAAGIGPGDEVITSPITFPATANAALYLGAKPVFADVNPDTLLIDPEIAEQKITPETKAIVTVDYAGQTCDYDALRYICSRHELTLIADSCHAIGARYKGRKTGSLADYTIFSFHPVKHICTGEGGMILTEDPDQAEKMRRFRNHGINSDVHQRHKEGSWLYGVEELGFNYRITDIQSSLGISQLQKLDKWLEERNSIATLYREHFSTSEVIHPLADHEYGFHAYHLFVVRIPGEKRQKIFRKMRAAEVGVNVHYIPVHLHPLYRDLGYIPGLCPVAEQVYESILSLPIFPSLGEQNVDYISGTLKQLLEEA